MYAASIGVIAPTDPSLFVVQHDRLVLQHTADLYNQDPEGNLHKADQNWPTLLARAGP